MGPIPELLGVAARGGESVRAFVTDDNQTAIVREGATIVLDWSRWVMETLGDSAANASYTLIKTQRDELGDPIGAPEVLGPSQPGDRITLTFSSQTDEYYVEIFRVVTAAGAEDPDRAIYELEACVPEPDGSEQCSTSSITVYAIDEPTLPTIFPPGKIL